MPRFDRRFAVAALALATSLTCLPAAAQSADAVRNAARKALQGNPEVAARLHAYLGKVENQSAAAAGWLPRVDLRADASVNRSTNTDNSKRDVKTGGVGLNLTQILWDGFATRNEVTRAGHERLSRWFELADTAEQVTLEATRALYDVQRQRTLVSLAEDNLVQHQQAAAKLEQRVKSGVGRGVDLDQAMARLALAEANRDTELANLHDVAARYQRIVGELPVADAGAAELIRAGLPTSAQEAVRVALARNAAIAAGVESLRAARAAEAARRSAYQPQVVARAGLNGGKNLGGVDGRKADASVGIELNWNLYAGGGDSARVREQQQAVSEAMDLRDKACRDTRQTALIAFNDAQKLSVQLNTLGRNSAAIERARDAYRQQFDIGQRSLLDLLNAENEAYTARRTLTNAVYDRAIAYARSLAASNQLTVQLGLTRDLMPEDATNWSAGEDAAGRCPATPVDVTPLRAAVDMGRQLAGMSNTPAAADAGGASTFAVRPMAAERPSDAMAIPARVTARLPERVADAAPSGGAAPSLHPTQAVQARVQELTETWRQRDAAGLRELYAPGYKGDSPSPSAWLGAQRSQLSGSGELDVAIEDLSTRALSDKLVEARFLRQTRTPSGVAVNHFTQTWMQSDGQWRIVRERRL